MTNLVIADTVLPNRMPTIFLHADYKLFYHMR